MNAPCRSRRRTSRGPRFSLASILLLTAVVAVLLAGVRTAMTSSRERPGEEQTVALAIGGLLIGAMIGAAVGAIRHPRRWVRAGCFGLMIGMIFGAPAAIVLATPKTAPVIAAGAAVVLLFAIAVRLLSGKPPRQS